MSQTVQTLQSSNSDLNDQVVQLHLLHDDLENRSCRQNIRLRGVPKSVPQSELRATVANIFNRYLDCTPDSEVTEPWAQDQIRQTDQRMSYAAYTLLSSRKTYYSELGG